MKIVLVLLAFAIALTPALAQDNARTDASDIYRGRQDHLVLLAETLGELHHLRQLCHRNSRPDLWRERMKELVTLEEPVAVTRQKMIEGFNHRFKKAEKKWTNCAFDAVEQARSLAREGRAIANLLADPFQQPSGEEFYPGLGEARIENGVKVYRGKIE
ncbi:MAG: TIGR02301 family protein [Parvularculaceae bacterium]